jgi:anoctamin-10
MVTQFGYVTVWSIVWPLAPVFAFINNYVELRSDALKLSKHVRRPVGDRVETIGSWLETLASLLGPRARWPTNCQSIISWIGAITNATLIYLFRPTHALAAASQSPNPNVPSYPGSAHLVNIVSTYSSSPALRTLLPTLIPLAMIALAASHGFIILRWIVEALSERTLWRGSPEEIEVQKIRARNDADVRGELEKLGKRQYGNEALRGGFWNGGEEGARAIGQVLKAE